MGSRPTIARAPPSRLRSAATPGTPQPGTTSSCCCAAPAQPRRARGPGNGSGALGHGRRGAGSGTPGQGVLTVVASLTFLTPRGGLLGLVALIPLGALAISTLRVERIARALGLAPARRREAAVPATLAVAACVLVGLAAAQPAWRSTERHRARTASQVFFVVDVSRSMAAAGEPLGAHAPGSRALRRHPATRRRADRAGGSRGADRPSPPVPVPDPRRARLPGDPGALGAHRVAAAPAGQHERDELRGARLARARRVLRAGRDAADLRARHRRRVALLLRGRRGRCPPGAARLPAARRPGRRGRRACLRRRRRRRRPAYTPDPAAADRTRALAEAAGGQAVLGGGSAGRGRGRAAGSGGRADRPAADRRRPIGRSLPTPRHWRWQPSSPWSSCVSGTRGCTRSSRKRKIQPCGFADTSSLPR